MIKNTKVSEPQLRSHKNISSPIAQYFGIKVSLKMKIATTLLCILASKTTIAFSPQQTMRTTTAPPKSQSLINMLGVSEMAEVAIPTFLMVFAVAVSVATPLFMKEQEQDEKEQESPDHHHDVPAMMTASERMVVAPASGKSPPEKTSAVGRKTTFSAIPAVPAPAAVEAVQKYSWGAEQKADGAGVAKRIKLNKLPGNAINLLKTVFFPWVGLIPGMKA
jgi:hypothetical protein